MTNSNNFLVRSFCPLCGSSDHIQIYMTRTKGIRVIDIPSSVSWPVKDRSSKGLFNGTLTATKPPRDLAAHHSCYLSLGKTDAARQAAYSSLFEQLIAPETTTEIRNAINKAWVLGDDCFVKQIEAQTGRRAAPLPRGGDRK